MADHPMEYERIPGALGTDEGYVLCKVKQITAAAVANDDTITFGNVKDVILGLITSEVGSIMDFDAKTVTTAVAFTVNTTVITTGTAATKIEGMALIRA